MRVAIVSHLYADHQHRGKLRALAGLGAGLAVSTPGGVAGLDGSVRIIPVPATGSAADPGSLRWNGRAIRRALSDFHPNLLHIEEEPGTQGAATAAAAARKLGIPYTVFSWESLPRRLGFFGSRRYAATVKHAAALIGGNQIAATLLRNSAPGVRATALPQAGTLVPSEDPLAAPPPAGRPALRLGFVGRLVPERGGEMLLRACAQLFGAWTLSVVGTGPEQQPLEELAERLGLASRIRWLGGIPRADLDLLWGQIDCLVVPSIDTPSWVERWSPVLLDAMARGIAPVVTPAGALPELIGDAGVVAKDTEGLAEALQILLAEPERVRALGQKARQRVLNEFVDAAVAKRTLDFWKQVLTPATGRQ
ncbi:MAG: glycosyltransferase family 4 protein [Gemmatimonadales bacterium]|nr:glycosyltransferase family 4 protein [Gemmatimonadales bacterium]